MTEKKNNLLLILGLFYCLIFGYLLFAASFRQNTFTEINYIPFRTLYQDIRLAIVAPPSAHYIVFTLGAFLSNLLLLFPLPTFFQLKLYQWKIWAFALLIPVLLEFLQYAFQVGSADIDDVVLNATGGYLGAVFARKF